MESSSAVLDAISSYSKSSRNRFHTKLMHSNRNRAFLNGIQI